MHPLASPSVVPSARTIVSTVETIVFSSLFQEPLRKERPGSTAKASPPKADLRDSCL